MKVVIVLLAALVLVLVRTSIICNELKIDTNHSNKIVVVVLLRLLLLTQTLATMEIVMVVIIGFVFILRFVNKS